MACITITEYNPANGSILGIYTMEDGYIPESVKDYVAGEYSALEFFVNTKAVPPKAQKRPKMKISQSVTRIKADGVEVVKLSKLPKPCAVLVNGFEYEVTDGVFEWGTHLPGAHTLRVVAFPFLDWEGTVEAE